MRKTMLQALAQLYGCDSSAQAIDRAVYKATDCGASVAFADNTATLHSIVEGSDAEFESGPITFKTTRQFLRDWQEAIDWLEGEVDVAWREANAETTE